MALGEDEDVEISGVANDINALLSGMRSRRGHRRGGRGDGREAVAAGAVAVVSSEPIDGLADVPVVSWRTWTRRWRILRGCFTAIPPRR